MDLLYDFNRFYRNHPNKKIAVFFNTGIVQESTENLRKFFEQQKDNVSAYIPENSVYELKLLSQYSSIPKYRQKADLLLNSCSTANAWSYSDIHTYKTQFLSSYHCDIALFIFYEPAAAEAFSRNMGEQKNVFILSYDPYNKACLFNSAIPSGKSIYRSCKPLGNIPTDKCFKPEDKLVVQTRDRKVTKELKMADLKVFHGGGEALLFTSEDMPGKLLKIYKYSPGDNMVNKLRLMITFKDLFSGCVLPSELLYRNGKCVGYVMSRASGSDLNCVLSDYNDIQRKNLIRDVSVTLLELRISQFVVTDLSAGNILVGNDGKIKIIDCDGMEFYNYPGGGVTPPYGHPDVTEEYFYKKLRTQEQINFSYAVMLFEILLGWKNPLIQKGLGDTDPEWKKHKFPYSNNNGCGTAASGVSPNEEKLQLWCKQPQEIRQAFEDVFTFKTTYDIGEWIKKTGII